MFLSHWFDVFINTLALKTSQNIYRVCGKEVLYEYIFSMFIDEKPNLVVIKEENNYYNHELPLNDTLF